MSHYEFLKEVGIDGKVLWIGEPFYDKDGTFSVEVTDTEGWNSMIILFDKEGNYLDRED